MTGPSHIPAGKSVFADDGVIRTEWPSLETSYTHLLRHTFEEAEKEGRLVSVVVVGAMDGRRFDALYPYLSKGLARAVLIEPIPDRFALLQETFAGLENLTYENCAIDATVGTRNMLYIPIDAVESNELPEDVIGMSSFYDDRNGLGGVGGSKKRFEAIECHRQWIEVRTSPLSDIIRKHGFAHIDILQTDTEGHDLHVLKSLDMEVVEPDTIFMEYYNMPREERAELVDIFEARNYIYGSARKDICATKHRLRATKGSPLAPFFRKLKRSIGKRVARLTS